MGIFRPVGMAMVVLAVTVFGVVSLGKLPVDLLPPIDYPSITVRTIYPGAAPEDLEERVTERLEDSLATVGLMDSKTLTKHFESIGARLSFRPMSRWRDRETFGESFTVDIGTDKRGEFFDIALGDDAPEFELLQCRKKDRHLLLYSRDGQRFLCGFDERHWFVAAVEGPVSTIRGAKQALVPEGLSEQIRGFNPKILDSRRNAAYVRQGEWFFVPSDNEVPKTAVVIRNEPLIRAPGNKPHTCEEICRYGGELVYVVNGIVMSEKNYKNRINRKPTFARIPYRTMVRNPIVYARGHVRHKDHSTIMLNGWHRVYINGEVTTSNITFLD